MCSFQAWPDFRLWWSHSKATLQTMRCLSWKLAESPGSHLQAPFEPDMVLTCSCSSLEEEAKNDQKFKVILHCVGSWKPAWATWDSIPKEKHKFSTSGSWGKKKFSRGTGKKCRMVCLVVVLKRSPPDSNAPPSLAALTVSHQPKVVSNSIPEERDRGLSLERTKRKHWLN